MHFSYREDWGRSTAGTASRTAYSRIQQNMEGRELSVLASLVSTTSYSLAMLTVPASEFLLQGAVRAW